MNVAVVVDSGSNYYNENLDVKGIFAIPLQIIDGDTSYLESIEISTEAVNQKMHEGKIMKTSLPAPGAIVSLFEDLKKQGYDHIFAIPLSSGISGTLNAMVNAAEMANISFDYVDCYTTFHIPLACALEARKRFNRGESIATVKEVLNKNLENADTLIIPDDLDYLARGGRLSPASAKLGGLLKIKPILHLGYATKGLLDPVDKVRTTYKAVDVVIDQFIQAGVNEDFMITIAHVDAPELCQYVVEKFQETFPHNKIEVRDLISSIAIHGGLKSVAFQYMRKFKD